MPAPLGNRNAVRTDHRTSFLHVKVTRAEKGRVVRDAGGEKLSAYVRRKLGLGRPETSE
jgi:hypothetical protein